MKMMWMLAAAGFMLAGNVMADDDKPKAEAKKQVKVEVRAATVTDGNETEGKATEEGDSEAKGESSATSTVTVMVVGEDGKVIKKSTSTTSSSGESPVDGAQKINVQVIDGKKTIEITTPDGKKKTINIGAAAGGDVLGKVMAWTFKADGEGGLSEVKGVQEEIAKALKDIDVDVQIDADKIADQVKAAIIRVKPMGDMAKELSGEVLMEFGDSAFIVESDETEAAEGEKKEGGKIVRRPLQIRRLSAPAPGMAEVMKKLEEISQRLEKIEARLEQVEKE